MEHDDECELVTFRSAMMDQHPHIFLDKDEFEKIRAARLTDMCWCRGRVHGKQLTLKTFDLMWQNFVRFCANNSMGRARGHTAQEAWAEISNPVLAQVIEVDFRNRRRLESPNDA